MKSFRLLPVMSVCVLGVNAQSVPDPLPHAVPLIVQSIDETQRVVFKGSVRAEVRPEFDRGPVADSFALNGMQLQLRRSPEHERAADTLANDLQRAGSPRFHQWLTPEEFAEHFGVAQEDIATISAWLRSHGFTVDDPHPSRMIVTFSGTAGQVREAFQTEIHNLDVNGQRHIANIRNPSIPAALAPAVEGLVSLHDFRPRPALVQKTQVPKRQFDIPGPGFTFFALAPADLAKIYNFNPLFAAGITGKGQTIALIEDSDLYSASDWSTFRQTFGFDAYAGASLQTVHPGKGCSDPGSNIDDVEASVDAEWASAAAPSAGLLMVTCANTTTTFGVLIALQNLLNQHPLPQMISMSYGECEVQSGPTANAAYKAAYQQAVLEGTSVFVAAGDNGPAMCDEDSLIPVQSGVSVNALASTPYNVAVGGTDFADYSMGTTSKYWSSSNGPTYASALSYVPEFPWNDTCASPYVASYFNYATTYGPSGLCDGSIGSAFQIPIAGAGGPSGCATGESLLGVLATNPSYTGPTPVDGACRGWPKPAWQNVTGNPNDGVRDLPDISLFAADGVWDHAYIFCDSDPAADLGYPCVGSPENWLLSGGTSFASPIMAGIQALVNQVWGGSQGNPAPVYYALANLQYGLLGNSACDSFATGGPVPTCIFHDITEGTTDVDCTGPYNCYAPPGTAGTVGVLSLSDSAYEPAYPAGTGWDFTTGVGTPNAANLVLNPIWLFGLGK